MQEADRSVQFTRNQNSKQRRFPGKCGFGHLVFCFTPVVGLGVGKAEGGGGQPVVELPHRGNRWREQNLSSVDKLFNSQKLNVRSSSTTLSRYRYSKGKRGQAGIRVLKLHGSTHLKALLHQGGGA